MSQLLPYDILCSDAWKENEPVRLSSEAVREEGAGGGEGGVLDGEQPHGVRERRQHEEKMEVIESLRLGRERKEHGSWA